jgi:hypothetical protein
MFYSIVPLSVVFSNMEEEKGQTFKEIEYLGEKVVVTSTAQNEYVINRILSTSPKAFLNPKLQPGTVIKGELKNI